MKKIRTLYGFDDIVCLPRYSEIESRHTPNVSTVLHSRYDDKLDLHLELPLLSANMDTVSEESMCIAMKRNGGIGTMHRFMSIERNVEAFKTVLNESSYCLVTVGTNDWMERSEALYEAGARHFVIDIAHGHSSLMKRAINGLRLRYGKEIMIIAGNVCTGEAVKDLTSWGADVIKVGISAGAVCTTRLQTGHGSPQFSAILDSAESANVDIIADGGVKNSGDILKSFVAGAQAVMLGSLLAGTDETPGAVLTGTDGKFYKDYRGMSSKEAQLHRKSSDDRITVSPEGISSHIPLKGPVSPILQELAMGLRSGMSYCNAKDLEQIALNAEWCIQTHNGYIEGTPHINRHKV